MCEGGPKCPPLCWKRVGYQSVIRAGKTRLDAAHHRWQIRQPAVLCMLRSSAKGLLRLLSATTIVKSISEVRPSNNRGTHHFVPVTHSLCDFLGFPSVEWLDIRTAWIILRALSVNQPFLRTVGTVRWWSPETGTKDGCLDSLRSLGMTEGDARSSRA